MKTILTFFCCCTLHLLFAQQPVKSIQVTVTDTIEELANHMNVMIEFKDTSGGDDYNAARKTDFTADYAEVIKLFNKYRVSWKNGMEGMGGMFGALAGGQKSFNIMADFNTVEQLDGTLDMLHRMKYVQTTEMGNTVDDSQVDKIRLYEKLVRLARKKADMIARIAGKKSGEVLQITDASVSTSPSSAPDQTGGMGALYSQILGMAGMSGQKRLDHKVPVSGTISITYYLVD